MQLVKSNRIMSCHPLESVPKNEEQAIRSMIETLKAKVIREMSGGEVERDAHPKQHGLVRAKFIVNPDLPKELQVGVFSEPKSYDAWLRFSNQNAPKQPDKTPDIRGLAIKLFGVSGPKLLEGSEESDTHDFITISTDAFISKNAAEFDQLLNNLVKGKLYLLWFFVRHLRSLWNLIKASRSYASPLDIRYFSTTPYLLGDNVVKYSVKPRAQSDLSIPKPASANYLGEVLQEQLKTDSFVMDFMVQRRTQPESMPIEDAGKLWKESEAPFFPVATIEIPTQVFNSPEQHRYGIELSFNPWRCLAEHRPLGGVNRARKTIYEAIAKFRHQKNGTKLEEPNKMKLF